MANCPVGSEVSPKISALKPAPGVEDESICQVQPDHGYLRVLNKYEGTHSSRAQDPGLLDSYYSVTTICLGTFPAESLRCLGLTPSQLSHHPRHTTLVSGSYLLGLL